MPPNLREKEVEKPTKEATSVRQETVKDDSFIENISFDKTALMLVGSTLLVGSCLLLFFDILGALPITITLVSAVFSLFSVRESKRDREATVAPTLFVGKREDEYGILNFGSGPAHELSMKVADSDHTEWNEIATELQGEILRVDDFLSLGTKDVPKYIQMEYRSNVGYKQYDVTREILSNNDD